MTAETIALKLVPVIDASLEIHRKERIPPMPHIVYSSQMAIYWFREAERSLKEATKTGIETQEGKVEEVVNGLPTLFTVKDYLVYVNTQLASIAKETSEFIKTNYLPEDTLYTVQRAYDRVHEALFNADLATSYYEQIKGE